MERKTAATHKQRSAELWVTALSTIPSPPVWQESTQRRTASGRNDATSRARSSRWSYSLLRLLCLRRCEPAASGRKLQHLILSAVSSVILMSVLSQLLSHWFRTSLKTQTQTAATASIGRQNASKMRLSLREDGRKTFIVVCCSTKMSSSHSLCPSHHLENVCSGGNPQKTIKRITMKTAIQSKQTSAPAALWAFKGSTPCLHSILVHSSLSKHKISFNWVRFHLFYALF